MISARVHHALAALRNAMRALTGGDLIIAGTTRAEQTNGWEEGLRSTLHFTSKHDTIHAHLLPCQASWHGNLSTTAYEAHITAALHKSFRSHQACLVNRPALLYCLHPYCSTWLTLVTVLEQRSPLDQRPAPPRAKRRHRSTGSCTDIGP
jgi:hypothetical protein